MSRVAAERVSPMTEYKIQVNREVCVGDRACSEEAPETFALDEDGKAFVMDPQGDSSEQVLRAAKQCVHEGITLHDAETGEQVWPKV